MTDSRWAGCWTREPGQSGSGMFPAASWCKSGCEEPTTCVTNHAHCWLSCHWRCPTLCQVSVTLDHLLDWYIPNPHSVSAFGSSHLCVLYTQPC